MTDWELLQAYLRDRSESAFATIVDRHWRMVVSVCRRETNERCSAEDAAQLAFLVLAKKARGLRPQTELASWLFVTARFTARNVVRRQARRKLLEARAAEEIIRQSKESVYGWPTVEPYLNDAIGKLKPADRAVVLLRYFDELSTEEVAVQLGISEGAVRVRLARSVGRLRDYFKRHGLFFTNAALVEVLTRHALVPVHGVAPTTLAKLAISITFPSNIPIADRLIELLKGLEQQMLIAKFTAVLATIGVVAGVGAASVGITHMTRNHGVARERATVVPGGGARYPNVDNVRSYDAVDLLPDPDHPSQPVVPFQAVGITRQGDVVGWYRTASPGKYGGTHYATYGFIASARGLKIVKDIEFGAAADSDNIGGSLLTLKVGVYRNGKFVGLPIPPAYVGAEVSAASGRFVAGGTYRNNGAGQPCIWADGKFIDLSPYIPRAYRANSPDRQKVPAYVCGVDSYGDVLMYYSQGDRGLDYLLLTAGHKFIDLNADEAFLNDSGDIVLRRQTVGQPSVVAIRSRTGAERCIEPLCGLWQGGIGAFNDRDDVLYTSSQPMTGQFQPGQRPDAPKGYYVYHAGKVTQLKLPFTLSSNDAYSDLSLLDDHDNVAGRVRMPDGKYHIVLFRPK